MKSSLRMTADAGGRRGTMKGNIQIAGTGCRRPIADCRPTAYVLLPIAFFLLLLTTACMVGPNYQRPAASVPAAFKEAPTDNPDEINRWRPAQPNEEAARGKWWEIYNDLDLNALEEQVNISNQNVLLAEAQFREAADAVRIARSALYPTITTSPSYARSEASGTLYNVSAGNLTGGQRNIYDVP